MKRLLLSLTALGAASVPAQSAKVDFAKQIWPIFEKRCTECHRAAYTGDDGREHKPKGRVELDSLDGIKQSKRGKLVVAGDSGKSILYEVITLPADDDDVMPPKKKGKPLSQKETDLIKRWIDGGADFGSWTGTAKGKSDEERKDDKGRDKSDGKSDGKSKPKAGSGSKSKKKGSPLTTLAKNLKPVPEDVLKGLAQGPFRIASVGDDSPLLEVTSFGETDAIDDARLADLLPIADHIAELDLAATRITDKAGAVLAKMPRLVTLDLRQTEIGDHGVAELGKCKELRSLNLYGTKVGDYGATALAPLANLEELYLWQTEVSAKTAVRLRETLPDLRIVMAADLPEPPAEAADGRPRRRR